MSMPARPDAQPDPASNDAPVEPAEEAAEPKDAHSLGKEFSQRAAQPGGTGERLGAERDARSNFTSAEVVARTVIGRDQINYVSVTSGHTRIRLVELSAEDLALDACFVRPPGFDRAEAATRTRRVAILRGRPGTGRYAYARHLLVNRRIGRIRRLHPETDLGVLSAADIEPGGYVLADLASDRAARLRAFDLDRLAAEFKDDRCLVVTVADDVRFADPDVENYVVDVPSADPGKVLSAHLTRLSGPDRAAALLGDVAVDALCRERLRGGTPAALVRLATLLASAGDPVAESVRKLLDAEEDFDLASWFESIDSHTTQTLAIGIAVLGGEPYELVATTAEWLERKLEPDNQPPRAPAPFGRTRSSRLRSLRAHLVPSAMPARHGGTVPGLVVRYQDRTLAQRVLLHVWDEYDAIRSELLGWLRFCARSEVPTVRVRAAIATGLLATKAFDTIRSTIILPWGRAAAPELRDAAACALGMAAEIPELREAVLALVSAWSGADATPRLRATAARAWRVLLAGGRCKDAVALLDDLGGSTEPVVIEAVCESLAEMLEYEESRYAAEALALVAGWSAGRDTERKLTSGLAFLLAAADLVRNGRPTLLWLAERHRVQIADLWRTALNSADFHLAAKDVLAEWAKLVDPDPAATAALASLLAAVATGHRTTRIIAIAVDRWTRAPHAAAAVRAALGVASSRRELR